jgi:hypothetical protein
MSTGKPLFISFAFLIFSSRLQLSILLCTKTFIFQPRLAKEKVAENVVSNATQRFEVYEDDRARRLEGNVPFRRVNRNSACPSQDLGVVLINQSTRRLSFSFHLQH